MYFYALHLTLTLTTISLHLVIIRVALQVNYEYVHGFFFCGMCKFLHYEMEIAHRWFILM